MGAIISLGLRGEPRAALPLAECAQRHPADVVQGLQIVKSLGQLAESPERTQALTALARTHPARAVRAAAAQLLV